MSGTKNCRKTGNLSSIFQVIRSQISLHPYKADKIILTTCLLNTFYVNIYQYNSMILLIQLWIYII